MPRCDGAAVETNLGLGTIGVTECDEWETAWARRDVYKARNAVKLLTMGNVILLRTVSRVEKVYSIRLEVKQGD